MAPCVRTKSSDAFDDFEIEFDLIEDASEEELKQFFQRLQQGLPLTSSEKLNSVHSELCNFCRAQAKHDFFCDSIVVANTRLAHFDILTKVAALEVDGLDSGLRFDDIKSVFTDQKNFSGTSAVAKRIKSTLDFLRAVFTSPNDRDAAGNNCDHDGREENEGHEAMPLRGCLCSVSHRCTVGRLEKRS